MRIKNILKCLLSFVALIAIGMFWRESHSVDMHPKGSTAPAAISRQKPLSPFYNTSDARAPYAFPLGKAQRQIH